VSRTQIRRERLFSVLSSGSDAALIVVRAGSGFGKTSLLAGWARDRGQEAPTTVWVTAGETIRDPLAFWDAVLHLLGRAGLVERTGFRDVGVRGDVADVLPAALLRGFDSLPEPITLIVDDFERLAGSRVESELIELVRRTGNLRLVVATRTRSTMTGFVTASNVDTLTLVGDDLRFDDDEIGLLAEKMGVDATRRELAQLRDALDGWPFGIRAVFEHRRRTESGSLPAAHSAVFGVPMATGDPLDLGFAHRHLLASLEDVAGIDELPPTTVLDAFTIEQAEALGAPLTGHPVLDELESRGLGNWEGDLEPRRFRLHPVLRQALRQELDRDPDDARTAQTRLALWFASHDDFAGAFEAAVHAGEWELAGGYLRRSMFTVLVRLRLRPNVFDRIPADVLTNEPLLMLVSGIVHYGAGNHGKAVRTLLAAVAACERERIATPGPPTPDQVWVQGIVTAALRLIGRYELVPAALRRFTRMLSTVHDAEGVLDPSMLLFRAQTIITLSPCWTRWMPPSSSH